ncbi:MAG: glycosyl hydrolase [Actinomycetota bacterium]|nr:glycosyl hydrolase [Actinomycetota bacterium]MDA8359998.1 glycosyl hydrolase [Actinomycetota bacterium]
MGSAGDVAGGSRRLSAALHVVLRLPRRGVTRAGRIAALAVVGGLAVGPAALAGPAGAAPTSRTARPVGLVQAGNSKTTCIYASYGRQLVQVERATGITYDCLEVFSTEDPNWAQWQDPWITNPRYGYVKWVAADPNRHTLVIAENLVPDDVAATANWRLLGARGRFDIYAEHLAENLVAAGLGYSVIRLGPEMNGPWEVDWIGTKPSQWHDWALYFTQIVRTMRAVPGAHFLFDWNVNANYEDLPLAAYYPGNASVDIVGIDAYDEASMRLPPVGSLRRWPSLANEPLGLDAVYRFAREHGKPLSIPEWGTLSTHGDDGAYVSGIGQFVAHHVVAYESWYDAGDNHILQLSPRSAPRSFAAYVAAFGPRSVIARYEASRVRGGA